MGKYHHPKFTKQDIKDLIHHCRNLRPFEKRYPSGSMKGEFMSVTQRMKGSEAKKLGFKTQRIVDKEGNSRDIKIDDDGMYTIPVEYVYQDPVDYHIKELVKRNIFPVTAEVLDEVTRAYIKEADECTELIEKLEKEDPNSKQETNPDNNN